MSEGATAPPLQVVATAGHVDHGKSALILRLTGMDPDRWEEEKRRGLTLDLGFAWCTLPSGREIGFVDVPGHERFVRNMLAGAGPIRLVLFVVAADEGWKPQSEEHLAIVDVLGAEGAVVAVTKRDLVEDETLARREEEIRERTRGTALEGAPVVPCSSATGEGTEELRAALDAMVAAAPPPEDRGRPRMFLDRAFTIRGAGTVVTGTLTGGSVAVGDEVVIHPEGLRARIRSLQTHRRSVATARPVSRVAANLAGVARSGVERGDALTRPGQWRPTDLLEVSLRPVRSVEHPVTARGAYKLHLGAAERDVRLRLYGVQDLAPGEEAYARLRLSRGVAAAVGDRFVLREAGRRETVAGGVVLDTDPPRRPGSEPHRRLARRDDPELDLAVAVVSERGAVPASDLPPLIGAAPPEVAGAVRLGSWWVDEEALALLTEAVRSTLEEFHRLHPLRPGRDWAEIRRALPEAAPGLADALGRDLAGALLDHLEATGVVAREGTTVRLATHRVSLGPREEEARRLVAAVSAGEPTPPDARQLEASGFARELVEAAAATGRLVAVGADLVFTPAFVRRAEQVARVEASTPGGLTVSRFREALGTTRKYALPLLERFDALGITRRDGDVRRLTDG
jgi:selenocysteine-specific elongation factor